MEPIRNNENEAPERRNGREKGMTLVELMVVITILGLMAALITVNVVKRLKRAKQTLALREMQELGNAVKYFYMDHTRYPDTLEELKNPPEGSDSYLDTGDFNDPWGNPYEYEILDDEPVLRSFGADGTEGGTGNNQDIEYPQEDDE